MKEISVREMLANAVHFGHKASHWNPKVKPFIYKKAGDIHLFDLQKTAKYLKKACEELYRAARSGKVILFVSTKPQTKISLQEFQKETGLPIVVDKWIGGMLTNIDTMSKRIRFLKDLLEMEKTGEIEKFTKKEQAKLKQEREKLQIAFSGIMKMHRLPDIVFTIDSRRDVNALKEAKKLGIITIGICDSNADPDLLDFPIPGNDDSVSSLKYLLDDFVFQAIKEGRKFSIKKND